MSDLLTKAAVMLGHALKQANSDPKTELVVYLAPDAWMAAAGRVSRWTALVTTEPVDVASRVLVETPGEQEFTLSGIRFRMDLKRRTTFLA